MKKMKRLLALFLTLIFIGSAMSVTASAASIDTAKLVDSLPDSAAVLTKKAEDRVFDLCNRMAGAVEDWSEGTDGTAMYNQKYGERGCQKYDLYLPKNLDKTSPQGIILFIHGGSWNMGSKENFTWACRRFTKKGYITATLDYDLVDEGSKKMAKVTGSKEGSTIFDMIDDVRLCIKALDQQLRSMGINPCGLAVAGESAGSHLSMLFAYGHAKESAIPIKMIMNLTSAVSFKYGSNNASTPEDMVKLINGATHWNLTIDEYKNPGPETLKKLDSISPVSLITKDAPPTLMGFAGKDTTVGTNQYPTIKPVLDQYNIPNEVVWWPNSSHTLASDPGVLDNEWIPKCLEWLNRYLTGNVHS